MMWDCMMWEGVGYSCKIDGRIDGDLCIKVLEEELMPSIGYLHKTTSQVLFQQDSDPKHTCKKAKDWFKNNNRQLIPYPTWSPDLNPIKYLWQHLKRRLRGHPHCLEGY